MMTEMLARVKGELNKVYERFGWEKDLIDENSANVLRALMRDDADRVDIDGETAIVASVAVAAMDYASCEDVVRDGKAFQRSKLSTLTLAVYDDRVGFVLDVADCYEPAGWAGDTVYESIELRKVNIEELSGRYFPVVA